VVFFDVHQNRGLNSVVEAEVLLEVLQATDSEPFNFVRALVQYSLISLILVTIIISSQQIDLIILELNILTDSQVQLPVFQIVSAHDIFLY
jgi:phage-related holin